MPVVKTTARRLIPVKGPAKQTPAQDQKTFKKAPVKRIGMSLTKPAQKTPSVRVLKRDRVQTKLYQAPAISTLQVAHSKKAKKPTPKKLKDKNNNKVIKKVDAGKVKKGAAKVTKSKKGNDRLVPRNINVDTENCFVSDSSVPEFVSINTYHRWLIRALLKNNMTELKAVMKSNKISSDDFHKSFSYSDCRTAESIVILTGDSKLIEECYKMREALDEKKRIHPEPNMLQRKSTGQRNFYMLGRATRAIEMSRGGREGNNAFLNYETQSSRYDRDALVQLVEKGTEYKELLKMSQLKHSFFQMNQLEEHVVTAVRRGHCELAQAIASADAEYCCNDLHRITLKVGGKLPQKILGASVVKKCFRNQNITPLHTAAINPDGAKMLEQLRAVDPNINVPDQGNWYTIHYAAVNRNPGALQFLLRNGAAPSMLNKKHQSPLHVAAIAGRAETVKVLLEAISKLEKGDSGEGPQRAKSLINTRTREGDTALLLAVKNGHVDVVKTLLDNEIVLADAPSSTITNKVTPLMLASSLGYLEIAKLLVSKGALIEGKDKKKRTALTYSVLNGQHHTAAYLLSMGASLLKGDSSGNSPAHYASAYGWLHCLELLAEVDPDCLSLENDWKITPLTVAFMKGHYGIVSWLLDGEYKDHVNINAKDSEGYTLLSCLLAFSDPDVHGQLPEQIDYLLDKGADCSLTDSYNNTILHDFASLKIKLIKAGDKERKGMTEQQYRQCFEKLLKKAPNTVNARNENLQTPLHMALNQGNLRIFNWMLQTVDVTELLKEKWTANENFLHAMFRVPSTVWNESDWNDLRCPPNELYDILPILKKLQKQMPNEFSNWLCEKNTEEQEPALALVHSLSLTGHKDRRNENSKPFMSYMCDVIGWICDLHPKTPTLLLEETDTRGTISLLVYSFNIPLEDGSLQLLKTIVEKARESGELSKLLRQEVNKVPLPFVALTSNVAALRYLLQVSKEQNLTKGFHNAIMAGQQEGNIWKELKKSLLIKMIENTNFDLMGELVMTLEDWKAKDADGNSAWHYAAKSSHHRTLSLLKILETRGVPRERNGRGATPLHVAVQSCDGSANSVLEPIEWLVTKSNVAEQDAFGRTAVHYAFATFDQLNNRNLGAVEKDPIAVVSVLAMDIDEEELNVADVDGNTALHLAAAAGANICAVTLLRKGAKVSVKNKDGNTPLALAVLKGRQGVSLTLIQANSSVTEQVIEVRREKEKEIQWIWNSLKEEEEVVPNSTIPAQIVKRGLNWAAMVYVLLDCLGKNTNSMAQITACALREKQYNLANQLLKSLEALLDGKPLITEEDLILVFAESCKSQTLEEESVKKTVLERLLSLGCPILKNGTCPALETALFNQAWHLADFFKERIGREAWSQWKPVHVDEGPLKALLLAGNVFRVDFSRWIDNITKLKHMNALTCSMTLPVPKALTGLIDGKFTGLGWAALHGNDDLVYLLRKKGFNVNSADEQGRTPLMMAVLANEEKVITALCNDKLYHVVEAKKDKNVVKMKMSLGNHLAFTLNGRKRKTSESENENGEDSGSDQETEEEEEETKEKPSAKKLKITNKSLKLDLKDKKGRNILHYLVEPVAWENVELLTLFAKENKTLIKKLLQEKDSEGNTPVMLAAKNKQRRMTKTMTDISGENIKIDPIVMPPVDHLLCPYDISSDSAAFIKQFAAANDTKKPKEAENRPHKLTGFKDSGLVVYDDNTSQYFKVLLNKSDLSYGRFGFHNFYRMELVKRRDTELYNIFTNWGRIGCDDGEYQNTPFGTLEAAAKEFRSIFKSKTGQDWLPLQNFKDIPKKYRLIKVDKSPNSLAELELPKLKKEDEKDEVRAFIRDVSDPEKLKEFQNNIRRNLTCSSPFGRVTKEAIQKGREILKDCEVVAKQIQEAIDNKGDTQEKIIRLLNQANDLSSEFYSVIPIGNAEYSALRRYDDAGSIQEALGQLNRLSEVEIAARILTGSAERQDVERISYIQSAMECGLRAMNPDEAMSQNILQWIHNTKNANHQIKGIMEITPKRSVEKFEKFANEENQQYLLHGTRAVNVVSLLRDGFLIDPQNTQINGRLFGDGIYLADCFGKSHAYCQDSAGGWKYMLVCQVSFGKLAVRDKNLYKEENLKSYDSFHMQGTFYPKTSLTIDGVSMPFGPVKESETNHWRNDYSEFIIRDPNRVLPRFIIMYK